LSDVRCFGGQWSIADAAAAPVLDRFEFKLRQDIEGFADGVGRQAFHESFKVKAFMARGLQRYPRDGSQPGCQRSATFGELRTPSLKDRLTTRATG